MLAHPPANTNLSRVSISLVTLQCVCSAISIGCIISILLRNKSSHVEHSLILLLSIISSIFSILQYSIQLNHLNKMIEEHSTGNIQLPDKASTKTDVSSANNADQSLVSGLTWNYAHMDLTNNVSLDSCIRGGNFTETELSDFLAFNQTIESSYDTCMMEHFLRDGNRLLTSSRNSLFSGTTEEEYAPTESSPQSKETYKCMVCSDHIPRKLTLITDYLPREVNEHSLRSSVIVEQCRTVKDSSSVPNIVQGRRL
ncbi:hypothetical protein [Neorickettsia sennetsu]|uniref:Uncharacterized protein n=1 Tax=Ehrlichia sennetsu (strain ATCC VR-367 / Miyayama) TaxID=222891 RepID=Q2GEW2_EHRS3|nr:hypothetical protein [Neorickettsia sennetsu]ABD45800.1 hypothetical protein NSE_0083 [Neorickettsia sennetsu str. Miyayama]